MPKPFNKGPPRAFGSGLFLLSASALVSDEYTSFRQELITYASGSVVFECRLGCPLMGPAILTGNEEDNCQYGVRERD